MSIHQTKKANDPGEKKDCKTSKITLAFSAMSPCHDSSTPLDLVLAAIAGCGNAPFTVELGTGVLPLGINLVIVGSDVKIQGNYNEPIATVSGSRNFRVNDVNGCCVCGNFSWSDNVDGACPAPDFKRLNFGGSSILCVGAPFAALDT